MEEVDTQVEVAPEMRPVIERAIASDDIRSLHLGPAITVAPEASLRQVVETLQQRHIGCILVVGAGGRLAGIFTERDLLNRVAGKPIDWATEPVSAYMTKDPETLRPDDPIAWALNLMHTGGYRHVPLTDKDGEVVGVLSIKDIVEFLVDAFPSVLNFPPDPHRRPDDKGLGGGDG